MSKQKINKYKSSSKCKRQLPQANVITARKISL